MQHSAQRVVVKVGTSTLTDTDGTLDRVYINRLAAQIASQRDEHGRALILVSSGAIRAGMARLGMTKRPETIPQKQATASVGQTALMELYSGIFANYGIAVGQVLLTRADIASEERRGNARNTFETLLDLGVLPIVNENDTVAVDEIRVGDNDTLAAQVALLVQADALILLSDVDGLYDRDPTRDASARRILEVTNMDSLDAEAGSPTTLAGTGGMQTKLGAARMVTSAGIPMWIAHGRRSQIIEECLSNVRDAGTRFHEQRWSPAT